jgi:hypothetical protein
MGMAASQARFLGLTARKNNVEFEGQQVNQQRTTLSNESANYYNDLLGMSVPTPPSVDDYTKTTYTYEDGALTNTLTTMIPASDGSGTYTVSYMKSYTDDFALVSSASSVITQTGGGTTADPYTYSVGAKTLRTLGSSSVTTNEKCSPEDIANFEYYLYDEANNSVKQYYKNTDNTFYYKDANGNNVTDSSVSEDNLVISLYDSSKTNADTAVTLVTKQGDDYYKEVTTQSNAELTKLRSTDTYLKTLSDDEVTSLLDQENTYLKLLQSTYGNDTEWYVRYVQNASTSAWSPIFYNKATISGASYDNNGNSQSSVDCYTIGSKTKTEEVKNKKGVKVEKDSTGRYISITFPQYDENGDVKTGTVDQTYSLTTNTSTDEDAYNDAMNEYEFKKEQYDQSIQNINSKIEIIQQQDKNLELRLKQLDTEQSAISTELDAVKKVIEKNTESSFKTFG